MVSYCCVALEVLLSFGESPIVIKEDLSLELLGYHEPIRDNHPLKIKIKFCPFCGKKVIE